MWTSPDYLSLTTSPVCLLSIELVLHRTNSSVLLGWDDWGLLCVKLIRFCNYGGNIYLFIWSYTLENEWKINTLTVFVHYFLPKWRRLVHWGAFSRGAEWGLSGPVQAWTVVCEMTARQLHQECSHVYIYIFIYIYIYTLEFYVAILGLLGID